MGAVQVREVEGVGTTSKSHSSMLVGDDQFPHPTRTTMMTKAKSLRFDALGMVDAENNVSDPAIRIHKLLMPTDGCPCFDRTKNYGGFVFYGAISNIDRKVVHSVDITSYDGTKTTTISSGEVFVRDSDTLPSNGELTNRYKKFPGGQVHGRLFYVVCGKILADIKEFVLIMDGFAVQKGVLTFTSRFLNCNDDPNLSSVFHDKKEDVGPVMQEKLTSLMDTWFPWDKESNNQIELKCNIGIYSVQK
jgi:hypothetical protein